MLDQRLVRDNPQLISRELGRRGMDVDLTGLQLIAQQQRDLEERRSSLQAEGNQIGKEVGQRIKSGADPKGSEVAELRLKGNQIKHEVDQRSFKPSTLPKQSDETALSNFHGTLRIEQTKPICDLPMLQESLLNKGGSPATDFYVLGFIATVWTDIRRQFGIAEQVFT